MKATEIIPKLQEIAKELGLKVNDGRVLQEYYKRQEELDGDYIMSLAMSAFFSFKKSKEKKTKVAAVSTKKATEVGRKFLNEMKEQAEYVEYEEIHN